MTQRPRPSPSRQERGDNFTRLASFIKPELQVSHKEQHNASADRLNRSQLNVTINSPPPHSTEWSLTKWPKSGCNLCPLVGGWICKACSVHAVGCYSVLKRKEILIPAMMNLEVTVLNKISQSQKDRHRSYGSTYRQDLRAVRFTETENRMVGARDRGEKEAGGELVFNGDRLSSETDSGDGRSTV